jgi:hypothetical protein
MSADHPDPEPRPSQPEVDPEEPVGDFGEPGQSDEGGDSDVDLTSDG